VSGNEPLFKNAIMTYWAVILPDFIEQASILCLILASNVAHITSRNKKPDEWRDQPWETSCAPFGDHSSGKQLFDGQSD